MYSITCIIMYHIMYHIMYLQVGNIYPVLSFTWGFSGSWDPGLNRGLQAGPGLGF